MCERKGGEFTETPETPLIRQVIIYCPWASPPLSSGETDVIHCMSKIQNGFPNHLCVAVELTAHCPAGGRIKDSVIKIGMNYSKERPSTDPTDLAYEVMRLGL